VTFTAPETDDVIEVNWAGLRRSIDLGRFFDAELGPPLKGRRWACPVHDGQGPNFAVKDDRWKCHKCQASGDVFDYVAWRDRCTVVEAAVKLDPAGAFHTVRPRKPRAARQDAPKRPTDRKPDPPRETSQGSRGAFGATPDGRPRSTGSSAGPRNGSGRARGAPPSNG
jgi:hypothetical protein